MTKQEAVTAFWAVVAQNTANAAKREAEQDQAEERIAA